MAIEISSQRDRVESRTLSNIKVGAKNKRQSTSVNATNDNVTFSQNAKLFMEAKQTAQGAPDVRQDRIDALRPMVQTGTYLLDNQQIAQAVVQAEPGLFRS
ncbi:MAG: flagellar biosynthesis anti-sigma factor FlgM [Desulfovibrionaceae bacterium]|nr:flagellar biosynthesis anti-sigma factor FlgM [Desulfovibrionaceae bacterium]